MHTYLYNCHYSLPHYGVFTVNVILLQYQRQVLSENFRFLSLKILKVMDV